MIEFSGPSSEVEAAAIRDAASARASEAEIQLPRMIVRLRRLLGRNDPLDIIAQLTAVKTSGPVSGPDDTAAAFGVEARLQYLTGLALSLGERSSQKPDGRAVQQTWDLVDEIFDLETAVHMRPPSSDLSEADASVQFLLRLEHLLDRTQGYVSHLVRMLDTLFEPLDEVCRKEIGFTPTVLPKIVFACHGELQRRYTRVRALLTPFARAPEEFSPSEISAIFSEAHAGLFEYQSAEIAARACLPESEVRAALFALSSSFGDLPADLRPNAPNRMRRFPVIPIGEDTWFFSQQWSPLHDVVPWFFEFVRAEEKPKLEKRFLRCRDHAAEELTRNAMARIFGEDAVYGPLDYESEGIPTELDCLVDAWPLCLLLEVKAHRVTESARRGSPDRIRRLDSDLGKARRQAARAAEYLAGGVLDFRQPNSGEQLRLAAKPTKLARIAVSWERADPLTLTGGIEGEPGERIWNVSLADLLMVSEILSDPASFTAYLDLRTELARDPDFLPFMEADLLAGFLGERLIQERQISKRRSGARQIVGYQAAPLNDYFTARDLGFSAPKPDCGVPAQILAAIGQMMVVRNPEWLRVARAVLDENPAAWTGFSRALRRARRGGRNLAHARSYPVRLDAEVEVVLLTSRSKDCFEQMAKEASSRPGALVIAERQGSPRELRATSTPPSCSDLPRSSRSDPSMVE
ncbi:MAG TPA: hypothetical protein VI039_04860 [Solirubrobacterales bacterium]